MLLFLTETAQLKQIFFFYSHIYSLLILTALRDIDALSVCVLLEFLVQKTEKRREKTQQMVLAQ